MLDNEHLSRALAELRVRLTHDAETAHGSKLYNIAVGRLDLVDEIAAAMGEFRSRLIHDVETARGSKPYNIAVGRLDLFDEIARLIGDAHLPAPMPPARLTSAAQRYARVIEARGNVAPPRQWWEAYVPRMGVDTDAAIAVDAGRTRARVHQVREMLGIPPAPDALEQPKRGRRQRDIAAVRDRLGAVSDSDLAAEVGRHPCWIKNLRNLLHISAYAQGPAARIALDGRAGQVPDACLARELGCAVTTVMYFRQQRKIPAWRRPRKSGDGALTL